MTIFFRIVRVMVIMITIVYMGYHLTFFSLRKVEEVIEKKVAEEIEKKFPSKIKTSSYHSYQGSIFITNSEDEDILISDNVKNIPTSLNMKRKMNKVALKIYRKYGGRIEKAAKLYGQDCKVILAVITVESTGKERAKSNSGALGLMQIKPSTAVILSEFKNLKNKKEVIKNLFHPYKNILGGTEYLSQMKKRFGCMDAALAAYNMGPTKLTHLIKNGYNPSENNYVKKVRKVLATI